MDPPSTDTNWRTGTGYLNQTDSLSVWEGEFYRRAGGPMPKPHIKVSRTRFEVFTGPAIIQVNDDGTAHAEGLLPATRHMVVLFFLDENIDDQLDRARHTLLGNQANRYERRARRRVDKFVLYLRALDAHADGATAEQIGDVLFPTLSDAYPEYQRRKRAKDTLKQAMKLTKRWCIFAPRARR